MTGIRLARIATTIVLCLAAPAVMSQPTPSGGVDVQLRLDDLVESYAVSKRTLSFAIRDISFGYELSGAGRGALSDRKFTQPRKDIDQVITVGKEPRGIIIEKGPADQPVLRLRMANSKSDILVRAKFIRSTWSMLSDGQNVTIIAPAEDLQILPTILNQIGGAIGSEVVQHLGTLPGARMEKLQLRTSRTDGDQVIIQGNNIGFTISYPAVTATYSSEIKDGP